LSGKLLARPQIVIAHFPLHSAGIDAVATGYDALIQDFLEDGLMENLFMQRGE
jgi:hypothetical protein